MSIYSITPFTLLDFPNKSACIFWYAGCNMRCLYCYNPEIVLGKGVVTFPEAISFLESRKGLLDAVVFSGGECLIHKNSIEQIRAVKTMGFLVKIDTNGSQPKVLKTLAEANLIDYVAIDFKAPKEKVKAITQKNFHAEFIASLKVLIDCKIPFEVRTTYHSDLLDETDIKAMIAVLETHNYQGNFYIQHFRNNTETLQKLEYSTKNLTSATLATKAIKVVFR
ncbi:anaerobic ribonucleoside-triphosphate reductase activating protein [Flavobacterium sp.]|uniref:anaerobic ribonucleoside-triphosphate reductase activating protein n=1 Tax=Flavobacterium sp. TaxID=239 RepID=UPI002FD9A422